jgi:hypothetical protein
MKINCIAPCPKGAIDFLHTPACFVRLVSDDGLRRWSAEFYVKSKFHLLISYFDSYKITAMTKL